MTKNTMEMNPSNTTNTIIFRPLEVDDLRLVHRWMNDPAALKWVCEVADMPWETLLSRFKSGLSFTKSRCSTPHTVEHWMALLVLDDDGEQPLPLGWAQTWCGADSARGESWEWRRHLKLGITGGIDYLIGEETSRGQGLGSAMIRSLVNDVVFANNPYWMYAAASCSVDNVASQRALEKAGLKKVADIHDNEGHFVLNAIHREEFIGLGTHDINRDNDGDGDSDTCCSYNDYDFDEMPVQQQSSALFLGYSKQMWDNDEEPSVCDLAWYKLSPEQQAAAKQLGWKEDTWEDSDSDSDSD